MEKQESTGSEKQMEEWERIHQDESRLSLSQRKSKQLLKLKQIVTSLHSIFGPNLISATKKIRGERLTDQETNHLQSTVDKDELIDRVEGLISVFNEEYYNALQEITGKAFTVTKIEKKVVSENEETAHSEAEAESGRVSKLPKGFNKWDLKLIKLHESRPSDDKRIWVDFWTLKGLTDVGEILYNPTKDLFYFKPYKSKTPSFALTDEHGRKATTQARNYYFRVSPNPPVIEKQSV